MMLLLWILVVTSDLLGICGQLVINVSKGSDQAPVIQQSIRGNTTADTVVIEFLTPGGDAVTQVTDFRSKVTLTRYMVPGEEDLGQPLYQVFCFVSAYSGDMIPSEAVTKLRQKLPGTVRLADENRGTVVQDNPVRLNQSGFSAVSGQLSGLCREAAMTTFSSEHELSKILPAKQIPADLLLSVKEESGVSYANAARCADTSSITPSLACKCSLSSCVWWYPCSLKFCRNLNADGEHRCGIRTCSRCTVHNYLAPDPASCPWDLI